MIIIMTDVDGSLRGFWRALGLCLRPMTGLPQGRPSYCEKAGIGSDSRFRDIMDEALEYEDSASNVFKFISHIPDVVLHSITHL